MKVFTEKELMLLQEQNLFIAEKQNLLDDFESLSSYVSGVFHLNNKDDLRILNIGKQCSEKLALDAEEIVNMGLKFFYDFIHPYTIQYIFPEFKNYYQLNDHLKACNAFQIIKKNKVYQNFFTVTKIIKDRPFLASMTMDVRDLHHSKNIAKVINDNQFIRKNYQKFMSLTRQEKNILALVAEGYNNNEIGKKIFISRNTVRTHRNNIFRKLEISSIRELIQFADNFI